MEQFADYGYAIASLAGVSILGLLLNPLTAVRKMGKGVAAGGTPEQDYADPVYRLNRAYLNLSEMMGFFVAAVVAAMLAGVAPYWVNLLAVLFFLGRLAVLAIHLAGIGPMNMGPRTFVFVVGWACALILALMTLVAVF